MDQLAVRLIDFAGSQNNPLGWGVLMLSALVEYVFPFFPGDLITLFGAFLITARGWSFFAVFGSVLIGSGAGAMLDFWFGIWLQKRRAARQPRHPAIRERIDRLVERFRRHGEVYLVLNRFVPGIRPLFFVAAGMAGMRPRWVLAWALVSATLWNLLLIAAGSAAGKNFDALRKYLTTYARYAWLALGVIVLALVARWLYKRVTAR